MKKLVIDFGTEEITVIKVEIKGKVYNVLSSDSLEINRYINDSGTVDVRKVVDEIKDRLGKEATSLDINIVLPDYMTRVQYKETEKLEGLKPDDIKEPYGSKLTDKQIIHIGENGTDDITQLVFYSKQVLSGFIKEMYKQKMNVTSAISNYSAYQNTMPLLQRDGEDSGSAGAKTRIMVMVGSHNIGCVVMFGNLPVYMKETGVSLYDLYQNIKEQANGLKFSEFMYRYIRTQPRSDFDIQNPSKIHITQDNSEYEDVELTRDLFDSNLYESDDTSAVEAGEHGDRVVNIITSEVSTLMGMVCKDVKEVVDYISDQYGGTVVEICTNSETARRFFIKDLSDVYDVFSENELAEYINVEGIEINLRKLNRKSLGLCGCIGSLICDIKKGEDFYG